MYYYANVNFDTEFKKRLLDFFFLFSKKKVHMWSSLLLYFVTWIVTMHSAKGGRRAEGKRVALCPCSPVSVSMVSPHREGEREWEKMLQGQHCGVERDLRPLAMAGRSDDQAHSGGLQLLTTRMVRGPWSSHAVLVQGNSGTPKGPVFSGQRSAHPFLNPEPFSSGNHASLVLTLKLIFMSNVQKLLLSFLISLFLFNHC